MATGLGIRQQFNHHTTHWWLDTCKLVLEFWAPISNWKIHVSHHVYDFVG